MEIHAKLVEFQASTYNLEGLLGLGLGLGLALAMAPPHGLWRELRLGHQVSSMEYSGDKGVFDDSGRVGSDFHGDQTEQASVGSDCEQDEGEGYNRSADQCKCKWKESGHQIQGDFHSEMQRMLWIEAEGGAKKKGVQLSSEDEDENEESEGEKGSSKKKKKGKTSANGGAMARSVRGEGKERRAKEMEWRQTMEALENERIMMDRRWREREEQRRMREDARSERRDALITALLNKLRREEM
ncbi:hypothetical protein CK203_039525 [Vitis vinifera]|uniref:Uncharacterized protein n=1 Tax=Vitis vinifera TaxID=29760 RepID=A0A438HKF2_VITVI|nr:hypothetical protein CK203_039525 [Vitis vinifera]